MNIIVIFKILYAHAFAMRTFLETRKATTLLMYLHNCITDLHNECSEKCYKFHRKILGLSLTKYLEGSLLKIDWSIVIFLWNLKAFGTNILRKISLGDHFYHIFHVLHVIFNSFMVSLLWVYLSIFLITLPLLFLKAGIYFSDLRSWLEIHKPLLRLLTFDAPPSFTKTFCSIYWITVLFNAITYRALS